MPRTPNAGIDPVQTRRVIRRVTFWGLLANLLLALLKAVVGVAARSQALTADALHSISDSLSDVAILLGVRYWTSPPDAQHPYGHGRIENLVTVLVSAMVALAGAGIVWHALHSLQNLPNLTSPGWTAAIVAGFSIVVKESLFRWTRTAGVQVRSPALKANAWHHRSDAISSVPALITIGLAIGFPKWAWLDAVGAILVSAIVLHISWKMMYPALDILADRCATATEIDQIATLARDVEGVWDLHALRTRQAGGGILVDLHILVDGALPVRNGHAIASQVKHQLYAEGPDILDVIVHVEPFPEATPQPDGTREKAAVPCPSRQESV